MRKKDAIALFTTAAALARAVSLSRSRISQWPERLTERQADLVCGAALRLGKASSEQLSALRAGASEPPAERGAGDGGRGGVSKP